MAAYQESANPSVDRNRLLARFTLRLQIDAADLLLLRHFFTNSGAVSDLPVDAPPSLPVAGYSPILSQIVHALGSGGSQSIVDHDMSRPTSRHQQARDQAAISTLPASEWAGMHDHAHRVSLIEQRHICRSNSHGHGILKLLPDPGEACPWDPRPPGIAIHLCDFSLRRSRRLAEFPSASAS